MSESEVLQALSDIAWADIIEATSKWAWPAIAAVFLWRFYPTLKEVFASRAFEVEVAGMKISVQAAADEMRRSIQELQDEIERLDERIGPLDADKQREVIEPVDSGRDDTGEPPGTLDVAATAPPRAAETEPLRILWVDRDPETKAYAIAKLRDERAEVTLRSSATDALDLMRSDPAGVDVVVTDLLQRGAVEEEPEGIALIRQAREEGVALPIIVYDQEYAVHRFERSIQDAGGTAAISSPLVLYRTMDALRAGR